MSEKNRVEIHDFKDWKAGVYLIEAGCGQGKNYFVFNTLFPYAHENGKRMLVFSNRVALREQQQAQTQEKDVKLITYQSLEHDEYLETMQDTKNKVRGLMQQVGEYDYIILDEAHYLYQDAPFNKNTETIIELIEKYRSSKIIVLLSATPDLLKKYLRIDKPYFFKADYSYIKEVQYYTKRDTLDEIISKIPENEKIVVFADSKDRLKELHSEYPNSAYLDKDISSKEKSITDVSITDPIPILSRPSPLEDEAAQPPERKGTEAKSQSAIEIYRQIIIPYGYKRVPGDKQTLHIDAEAAAVVRRIFDMAASGASLAQIGQTLSDEKVLIPSAYEERYHPESARHHSYHDPYRWNTTTLTYILDRQEYLGHTVLCKSIRENFKLKKRRAATPEERIIFKNTHEAIIDQETWDKAQRLRKRNPKKLPSGTYSHRLAGMVFCADCGSRMSFSSPESKHRDSDVVYDSDSSWQCSKYRNMYVSCTSHFIKTSTIETAILNAIKAMTKEIIENEDEFAGQLQAAWENQNTQVSSESKKELHSVQKRMDELDALIRSLYENSVLGKIPERQYQRLMAQYDEEQTVCEARIAELKKELDNAETTKVDLKRFIKLIRKYKDCDTLTDEMLYELVEKVVIHSASGGRTIYRQQQIDIYFNFIGDTFPSQIEISRGDKKNLTEQQLAKRKKYQKTAGENRKKKRAALREAAKTDPQAVAEYEALLQKGRERGRKYAQNKKLAQQESADTVPIQFEPSEEMKGESA